MLPLATYMENQYILGSFQSVSMVMFMAGLAVYSHPDAGPAATVGLAKMRPFAEIIRLSGQ